MKKIIFLDVDGVLNSNPWNDTHQKEISVGLLIDEDKVKLLSEIISKTEASIILHSGWRVWFDENILPTRKESQLLVEILERNHILILGVTPDLSTEEVKVTKKYSLVKAKEILTWLQEHPEVERWVVIDDLYLHNDEVEKHQIKTNCLIGLTQADVDAAIDRLQ
ncbi:MAG: HAD domain-containing protein [Lachnotalea sp.]